MVNKDEISQAYYYTDIEPTLDNLNEIIRICDIFMKEGGDRLMCAMGMRKGSPEISWGWCAPSGRVFKIALKARHNLG